MYLSREDFLSRLSLAGREIYQSAYSFEKNEIKEKRIDIE